VGEANHAVAQANAQDVARRAGVRWIGLGALATLEASGRTVYRFDVRTPEEYEDGHLPAFASAPGGQLVQETDHHVPVRGARIVLADDDGVRAPMTASWLAQMGWEVYVVEATPSTARSARGRAPADHPVAQSVAGITPARLAEVLGDSPQDALVIDVTSSANYAKRHIPGAWFAIRAQLAQALDAIPAARRYVLTCGSSLLARFAAVDLRALLAARGRDAEVLVLEGGNAAWFAAGLPAESGWSRLATPASDRYRRPYEGTDAPAEAMQAYLDWEFGLVAQLAADGTHEFKVL
jgi:rhodanese-related sulfurtransferase